MKTGVTCYCAVNIKPVPCVANPRLTGRTRWRSRRGMYLLENRQPDGRSWRSWTRTQDARHLWSHACGHAELPDGEQRIWACMKATFAWRSCFVIVWSVTNSRWRKSRVASSLSSMLFDAKWTVTAQPLSRKKDSATSLTSTILEAHTFSIYKIQSFRTTHARSGRSGPAKAVRSRG